MTPQEILEKELGRWSIGEATAECVLKAMELYALQQVSEKDKRIKELEELLGKIKPLIQTFNAYFRHDERPGQLLTDIDSLTHNNHE